MCKIYTPTYYSGIFRKGVCRKKCPHFVDQPYCFITTAVWDKVEVLAVCIELITLELSFVGSPISPDSQLRIYVRFHCVKYQQSKYVIYVINGC